MSSKANTDKCDHIKPKSFCIARDVTGFEKRTELERTLANGSSDHDLFRLKDLRNAGDNASDGIATAMTKKNCKIKGVGKGQQQQTRHPMAAAHIWKRKKNGPRTATALPPNMNFNVK